MSPDRRTFFRTTGAALGAAAVATACASEATPDRSRNLDTGRVLDGRLLRSVALLVLPSELGPDGIEAAVQGFERWAGDYEPVAELNHGYGTSDIRYGPADPVPGWAAQLEALDLEANKRANSGFAALASTEADAILRRHIQDAGGGMPSPLQADHVGVALLAWWLSTPDATDRCYGVRISPETCRGIETAPLEPEAIA